MKWEECHKVPHSVKALVGPWTTLLSKMNRLMARCFNLFIIFVYCFRLFLYNQTSTSEMGCRAGPGLFPNSNLINHNSLAL